MPEMQIIVPRSPDCSDEKSPRHRVRIMRLVRTYTEEMTKYEIDTQPVV